MSCIESTRTRTPVRGQGARLGEVRCVSAVSRVNGVIGPERDRGPPRALAGPFAAKEDREVRRGRTWEFIRDKVPGKKGEKGSGCGEGVGSDLWVSTISEEMRLYLEYERRLRRLGSEEAASGGR